MNCLTYADRVWKPVHDHLHAGRLLNLAYGRAIVAEIKSLATIKFERVNDGKLNPDMNIPAVVR